LNANVNGISRELKEEKYCQMKEDIVLLSQIEILYNSTAKQLYNLTLLAIGDQLSAERITIDAFSDAFLAFDDKSNISSFKIYCVKRIYNTCKKEFVIYNINEPPQGNLDDPRRVKRQTLLKLLSMHKLKDRFLLLLFCQQKLSVKQISEILNMPSFMLKKRIYRVLTRTCQRRS
jgi:DNA-directed RNA polymerase specialized sigma24 family protein